MKKNMISLQKTNIYLLEKVSGNDEANINNQGNDEANINNQGNDEADINNQMSWKYKEVPSEKIQLFGGFDINIQGSIQSFDV